MIPNKNVRMVVVMLVVSMLVILSAACGSKGTDSSKEAGVTSDSSTGNSNKNSNDNNTDNNADQTIRFPLKNQITISAFTADFNRKRDTIIDQEFEKRTNIKIDWKLVPMSDLGQKRSVVLASGDIPDLIITNKGILDQYGSKGLFVDLYPYLDKMPNLQRWINKYPAILNDLLTADNKYYGINDFNTLGQMPIGYIYRDDIFKQNGLELPKTFDELYDSLVSLKNKYPNSTPIVNRWGAGNMMGPFFDAYHVKNGIYLNHESMDYQFGPTEENYKKAVAMMRKFYEAGLITPEFATLSDSQFIERIVNGNAFALLGEYFEEMDGWIQKGKANDPNFSLAAALPPVTDNGLQALVFPQYPTSDGGWVISISAKSKHIDEIVQMLDYQLTDEMIELINYGIEGKTFKKTDKGNEFLPEIRTIANPGGQKDSLEFGLDSRSGFWAPIDQVAWWKRNFGPVGLSSVDLYMKNMDEIAFWSGEKIQFTEEEQNKINTVMTPVNTYISETLIGFVTGKLNMDQDWDNFQKKIDSMGYKEILQMYQKKYSELPKERQELVKFSNN